MELIPHPHLQYRGLKKGRAIPLPTLRVVVACVEGTFTFNRYLLIVLHGYAQCVSLLCPMECACAEIFFNLCSECEVMYIFIINTYFLSFMKPSGPVVGIIYLCLVLFLPDWMLLLKL